MSKVIKKAYAEEMLGVFESGNQSGSSEKKAEIAECTVMSSLP